MIGRRESVMNVLEQEKRGGIDGIFKKIEMTTTGTIRGPLGAEVYALGAGRPADGRAQPVAGWVVLTWGGPIRRLIADRI
jgi:hypothetical protein